MAAERSSHLEALVANPDIEAQKKHATIIKWITDFIDTNGGIVETLIEERKALLSQKNSEAEIEGSPYMEPDSGAFDVTE